VKRIWQFGRAALLAAVTLFVSGAFAQATQGVATKDASARSATSVQIEAFVREGCPHCAKAEEFLAQLGKERPGLRIVIRDVQKEPAALERLKELARAQRGAVARVPAVYVGGQLIVGY